MKKTSKVRAFIKQHFAIIVLLAILTIPSIYTVLFLGSMWDPYGNLESLPVAVVNEDEAVSYNGKVMNIGRQMCDKLKKNASLQFNFVDEDVAMDGLDNGTYYMVIVIPDDFSYNATTLTSKNPTRMQLEYYTNPGNNYIASKISTSAVNTIKTSINESVINTYARTVLDSVEEAGNGFQRAADGSGQIKNGLIQLKDGNNQLSDGIKKLSDGSLTLKDGTKSLKAGTVTLLNGTYTLKDGTITLKAGTSQLKQGISDYTNGVSQVYSGTQQLVSNNDTINDGASQINDGLKEMSNTIGEALPADKQKDLVTLEDGLIELNDGIQTLNTALNKGESGEKIQKTISTLQTVSNELNDFVNSDFYKWIHQFKPGTDTSYESVKANLEKLAIWKYLPQTTKDTILAQVKAAFDDIETQIPDTSSLDNLDLKGISEQLTSLTSSLNELTTGVQQLSDGGNKALPVASSTLKSLSSGLLNVKDALDRTKAKDGKTGLIEGMTTLQSGLKTYTNGVSQVNSGVKQLNDNSEKLNSGAAQLDDGATQLEAGATKLANGAKQLNNGAVKLDNGALQIKNGLKKLSAGDVQLGTGVNKLLAGAKTLQSSLQAGADKVNSNNTGKAVSDMFSQPVTSSESQVSHINNNGEAMAAYMMCAALWVGCLAFCLMFSPYNSYLADRKGQKQFLKFSLISVFVAVVQAIAMIGLLMLIDGFAPTHLLGTFIIAVVVSLAFMSIVYFLNTLMGSVGSFVLLILLVFQLSGAAGTYPIELSPKFFQIIHPFLPFSYGVSAFRSTISTGASLAKPLMVFAGILVVFWALTLVTFFVRSYRQTREAKKELDEKFEDEMSYYNSEV